MPSLPVIIPSKHTFYPGEKVTLTCLFKDPGYPPVTSYQWFGRKGNAYLYKSQNANYSFVATYANTKDNYTCMGSTGSFETYHSRGVKIKVECKLLTHHLIVLY